MNKVLRRSVLLASLALLSMQLPAHAADRTEEPSAPIILQGTETTLAEWLWIKRPVVVFADNPADPRFQEQIALLTQRYAALEERDVVVIADSDPAAQSAVRRALRPRGFALVVMAKDGSIVTRKPRPWSVREITRQIDKLPLRQDEIKGF